MNETTFGSTEMQRAWMWQTMLAAVGTYGSVQFDTLGRVVPEDRMANRTGMIFEPGQSFNQRSDPHPLRRPPSHARKFTT